MMDRVFCGLVRGSLRLCRRSRPLRVCSRNPTRSFFSSSSADSSSPTGFQLPASSAAELSVESIDAALKLSIEQVRVRDPEHFVAVQFLPDASKMGVFALRAFDIDLEQAAGRAIGLSSEQLAGGLDQSEKGAEARMLRLHFMRECVDRMYALTPPNVPTVLAMSAAVQRYGLTRSKIEMLIDTRIFYMDKAAFLDMEDLRGFNSWTYQPVLELTLECCGVPAGQLSEASKRAVAHLAQAVGISRVLRNVPKEAHMQRLCLPVSLLQAHGAKREQFFRGEGPDSVRAVVYELSCEAKSHLSHCRALAAELPKEVRRALLPAVPCDMYLDKLEVCGFDVFHPALQGWIAFPHQTGLAPLQLRWRVLTHALRGIY
jgi:NADH dehydrogenase [ubiquinone] 1 alpha subcomplex assembly factor 6